MLMKNTSSRDAYTNPVCPVCEHKAREWFKRSDWYVDKCANCGFAFVRNVPSDQFLAEWYLRFCDDRKPASNQPKQSTGPYEPDSRQHKKFKNWWFAKRIKSFAGSRKRVLEVGYAHGNLLKALQREGNFTVEGIDYSEGPLQHLRSLGLNVSVSSLEDKHYPDGAFDIIVGLHVLEHVHNPMRFMQEVHRVLSPGGRIYFQVPCVSYWRSRLAGEKWKALTPPWHLWFFSTKAMRLFLTSHGFRVISAHCFSNRAHLTVLAEKT